MAPNITKKVLLIEDKEVIETIENPVAPPAGPRKYEISFMYVILFMYVHLAAIYGFYLCLTSAKWETIIFTYSMYWLANLGVTAGVHRLWCHRAYKAKMPLQIFLMLCNSMASQYTVANWVRDHRLHHKYSDTDADPHNATRGFFYSHIGWLLVKKDPVVEKHEKLIDLSDITSNPVLQFQTRHAIWLIATVAYILPTLIPVYFCNEALFDAWNINMLRFIINLNTLSLINSFAHKWGNKPYDKNIAPTESLPVNLATLGEGFHNYHHVFPQDYRAAELGNHKLNHATLFIDFCAWLGLVYDRKMVSDDMIKARAKRTGDGSNLMSTKERHTEDSGYAKSVSNFTS